MLYTCLLSLMSVFWSPSTGAVDRSCFQSVSERDEVNKEKLSRFKETVSHRPPKHASCIISTRENRIQRLHSC